MAFKKNNLLLRICTGLVYIAIIVVFFLLRNISENGQYNSIFNILIYIFMILSTYEMLQTFSRKKLDEFGREIASPSRLANSQKVCIYTYVICFIPIFYLSEYVFWHGKNFGYRGLLISSFFLAIMLLCLLVIDYKRVNLQNTGAAYLCSIYPTILFATILMANTYLPQQSSNLALILIFTISPVVDTFAYICGSLLKGKKLAPSLSPNKTVSGAIGGLIFGILACIFCYWIFVQYFGYEYKGINSRFAFTPWVLITLIGIGGSIMVQFGDLVESTIKRHLGVKDMSNILPGHGGILDRLDGTVFASAYIYIMFSVFFDPNLLNLIMASVHRV